MSQDDIDLGKGSYSIESYFEWIKNSDFVEYIQGHYRLDDVARDVFRKSYFQDSRIQFRKTNTLLAEYFKQQADYIVEPQTLLPDPYEDEDWKELISEYLYYGLFGDGKKGLQRFVEHAFTAIYLQEPDVFISPVISVMPDPEDEVEDLLPKNTLKFVESSGMALVLGWPFISRLPGSYKIELKTEQSSSTEVTDIFQKKIEDSIVSLLNYVSDLEDGFARCIGFLYKSIRSKSAREMRDTLLQSKEQSEQLKFVALPKLAFNVFYHLGNFLADTDINLAEEALECIDKALVLGEGDAKLLFLRGFALYQLKRYQEALESFHESIEMDPNSSNVWAVRGAALANLERYEAALESMEKSTSMEDPNPKNLWYWLNIVQVLFSERRYAEALEYILTIIYIDPENVNTLNYNALCLSHLGRFEEALEVISQTIEIEPKKALFKANRGIILARSGQYEKGLKECDHAIRQDPKHESGYYGKACCHALKSEIEQAVSSLKMAIDIAPLKSRSEAKANPDFDSIREDDRFYALVYPRENS